MSAASKHLTNAVRGPIIMITIGALFLFDKFTPFGFSETWPVILIVLGALALAGGTRRGGRFQDPFPPQPSYGPQPYGPPPGPRGYAPPPGPHGYYAPPSPQGPGAPPPPPPPGVRR
jgi:hypothetical protein